MAKKKKKIIIKKKDSSSISKLANFTTRSISTAFKSYKKSQEQKKIREIKNKQWPDVSSLDVYRLFEFGWTTTEITSHFNVRHYQVLNRLRKF